MLLGAGNWSLTWNAVISIRRRSGVGLPKTPADAAILRFDLVPGVRVRWPKQTRRRIHTQRPLVRVLPERTGRHFAVVRHDRIPAFAQSAENSDRVSRL